MLFIGNARAMSAGQNSLKPQRLPKKQACAVRDHVRHILASPAFSGSKRCQQFLQLAIKHALAGDYENLRERMIGVEIFGRPIDYETATDAIVRVKANEVRKRLAQYYLEASGDGPVRIDLPSGSYVPEFHWVLETPRAMPKPDPTVAAAHPKWLVPAAAAVILALAALAALAAPAYLATRVADPELHDFWAPMLNTKRPILVCLGQSEYFWVAPQVRREMDANSGPFRVKPGDIVRLRDDVISVGMMRALLGVSSLLDQHGKQSQVVWGGEVRFQDLRDQNVVLIGAFNNPWTLEMSKNLRFTFERQDTGDGRSLWSVREQSGQGRIWTLPELYPHPIAVDYAVVGRIFDKDRGRVIVSAGGFTQFGTEVAGDFLKDPVSWRDLTRQAPKDWRTKNLQVVLETSIAGKKPVRTRVLASYFW